MKLLLLLLSCTSVTYQTCHISANDCQIKYGPWSLCDPCKKVQSRHLNITQPPQSDGLPCPTTLIEHQSCAPITICPAALPCPGQFDCGMGDRCINNTLLCNGDNDCGNNRDEMNCSSALYSRSLEQCLNLAPLPYLDHLGAGIHFATGELAGRTLDHQVFNGLCRQAFDEDQGKIFRMPYNVDNFRFRVVASDDLNVKTYNSLKQYTDELDKASSTKLDTSSSVSGGFWGAKFSISESSSYSHDTTFKSVYNAMHSQSSTLFHIFSELQVAEFVMKETDLVLDDYFHQRVSQLPTDLNIKSFSDFFDHFGTTYLKSGTLGGRYSHLYVYSQEDMKKNHQTVATLSKDLKLSVSASLSYGIFKASTSVTHENSNNQSQTVSNAFTAESSATHKLVHILGGTTVAAGKLGSGDMVGNGTFNEGAYQAWVAGVKTNPVILTKSLKPICQLILFARVQNSSQKHEICQQALEKYLQPYLPAACRDCKNGGKKLNINGQCQCACGALFGGDLCASNWRNIPVQSSNARNFYGESSRGLSLVSDTTQDIKLITDSNHRAISPPYLTKRSVGAYDNILKMQEERLFLLQSDQGIVAMQPTVNGYVNITEFDEYLKQLSTIQIDFTSIADCTNPHTIFCEVFDFDRDTHGYFVIVVKLCFYVQILSRLSQFIDHGPKEVYNVYRLDSNGRAVVSIDDPCDIMTTPITSVGAQVHVTTTCDDTIVVSCPMVPATIKVYNMNGEPEDLSQFQLYNSITGLQYFNNSVWFHTKTHQVGAFNLYTWTQTYSYNIDSSDSDIQSLSYTNLYVDFVGNLVIGQYANEGLAENTAKFTIIETTSSTPLVIGVMPGWDECPYVTTYRGKLYVLCQRTEESEKSILVFDYLR